MGNLRYTNLPSDISKEDALTQLALDVSSTWSGAADALWRQLNPELWERTRNPWVVLQTVSGERLKTITSTPDFRAILNELVRVRSEENESPRWFEQSHQNSAKELPVLRPYHYQSYCLHHHMPIDHHGVGKNLKTSLNPQFFMNSKIHGFKLF